MVEAKRVQEGAVDTHKAFFQANPSVDFVRLQWVDYSGILYCRVATKTFALALAERKATLNMPCSILLAQLINVALVMDELDTGADQICPDWSSLKISKEFRLCPRSRLQEIIRSAKEQHDIDFLVGTEIEFYIVDGDQSVQMVPNPSSAASLRNRFLPIVEEIVDCLINAGIAVHQFHSEGSPGLFEISLEPLPPVEAVDAVVYGQETIKTVCANHGLRGTMFPKPFEKLFTAGLHYHLSISRVDKQESFLEGLLGSWASLAAFCMPNYDSYTRVTRGQDVFWGYENRTAVIRKVSDGHWELRAPDGTSNPHLTLAAILAAGLKDVEEGKPLTVQDPKGYVFEPLTQEQRTELGITDAMPQSLEAALEALRADKTLPDALGAEIVEKYLKIKTMEEQAFREMTLQKRKSVSMNLF